MQNPSSERDFILPNADGGVYRLDNYRADVLKPALKKVAEAEIIYDQTLECGQALDDPTQFRSRLDEEQFSTSKPGNKWKCCSLYWPSALTRQPAR